ncbi:MAG: glycosyltransferase family 2 protein [Persicimonas sp.]
MVYSALSETTQSHSPQREEAGAVEAARVAVVVPAYREARLLPRTLATMPAFVDRVIVVDDGSPDQTFAIAREHAAVEERVEAIRLGFNQGVGRAICRGYERALEIGSDVVAVMAADNQMDPADLRSVVEPVASGRADYAKGDRLSHPDAHKMPWLRRLGTDLLARVTGLVAGFERLSDSQCGYTAIRAELLEELPLDDLYPSYGYPNDMLLRLGARDVRLVEPTVRPVYADEESDLCITAVVVPIAGILARAAMRRLRTRWSR